MQESRFKVGQIVHHQKFGYRGVVIGIDEDLVLRGIVLGIISW